MPKKLRDLWMKGINKHMETWQICFDTLRDLSQSKENKCIFTHSKASTTWQFRVRTTRERKKEKGRSGGDGKKIECKLSEVNTRTVSRGQIELMTAGDVISIRGRLWHTCAFQQELKGSLWDLVWIATGRGKLEVRADWDDWSPSLWLGVQPM